MGLVYLPTNWSHKNQPLKVNIESSHGSSGILLSRRWRQFFFNVHPDPLGKCSNLTKNFSNGWLNHHLVIFVLHRFILTNPPSRPLNYPTCSVLRPTHDDEGHDRNNDRKPKGRVNWIVPRAPLTVDGWAQDETHGNVGYMYLETKSSVSSWK